MKKIFESLKNMCGRGNKYPLKLILLSKKFHIGRDNEIIFEAKKMRKFKLKLENNSFLKIEKYVKLFDVEIRCRGNNTKIVIKKGARLGKNLIRMGENSTLIIGENTFLEHSRIYIKDNCNVVIGDNNFIRNSQIRLEDKNSFSIGINTKIGGLEAHGEGEDNYIEIGKNRLISWDVEMRTSDFHKIYQNGVRINIEKPIVVEDDVWLGKGATILKGVTIKRGCIVGNKTMVTKTIDRENVILAGNPAKVVKENISWRE